MNVKIGTCGRAVPFLGIFVSNKEYINGIFVAVWFFLGLEIFTPTAEIRWRRGFAYIIYLFTFKSSTVLSHITLYLCIKNFFPH
jgi:hypothetical protein